MQPLQQDTDATLARRIQDGDRAAFDALVVRYRDRVYRLATGMLFAPDTAEDATQEVFLRAWQGIPGFRFRSTVYTWLYATLRNVCREHNRRARPVSAVAADELPDVRYEPARVSDAEQRLEQVLREVRALPERQRDVLLLRVLEGLSVKDTARVLGCRPGTVKTHLHRALAVLRATGPDDAPARGEDLRS